jgi:hypothetical protein
MDAKDKAKNCKYCNRIFSSVAQRVAHEKPCEQLQEYNKLFGSYSFAQEVYMSVMQTTDKLETLLQKHKAL